MTKTTALKFAQNVALNVASAFALSAAALGAAHAATVPADKYGYEFRAHDTFTDGARTGKVDTYTDGARTVAGLDKVGVSAAPGRTFDPYLDGARA